MYGSRDATVRFLKNRIIFEIALEEGLKHTVKTRINNKLKFMTVTCFLTREGMPDSYKNGPSLSRTSIVQVAEGTEALPSSLKEPETSDLR